MKKGPKSFTDTVEDALMGMLKQDGLEPADRIKCLAVSVRWAAVKARLVLPEHGEGFLDDDSDSVVE